MIEQAIRENIKKLKPYESARITASDGILLDANENSLGSTVEIPDTALNRYPDPNHTLLRKKAADYLNEKPGRLAFGTGSDELIDLLVRIFCEPNHDSVITCEPTYGMYKVICDIHSVSVKQVLLQKNFQLDIKGVQNAIDAATKIIFICSPNNPTGSRLHEEDIEAVAKSFPGIIVLDEAYTDFTNDVYNLSSKNIVRLRTFSKAWGLAGIRCGYAIADETIIDYIYRVKMPYNLNSITAKLVAKALENNQQKEYFVNELIKQRDFVFNELSGISGVRKVYHSDANFLLFKCNEAESLFTFLKKNGIIIRNRSTQPMLENCLRVTIGNRNENQLFINKVREFYA